MRDGVRRTASVPNRGCQVTVRARPRELDAWDAAAAHEEMTFAEWARTVLNDAARQHADRTNGG